MRWMVLFMLALLAAVPAQASSHDDGEDVTVENEAGDVGENDQGDANPGDGNAGDGDETVGAGRDDGGDGLSTPWSVLLVLGIIIVIAVVAALFFAARRN